MNAAADCMLPAPMRRVPRVRCSTCVGLLVLALSLLGSARVDAQADTAAPEDGVTSTLSWTRLSGAERCPTVVEVGRAVEAVLGRSVLVEAQRADRIVEASVALGPEGHFVASIQVASPEGEVLGRREITSRDPECADLAETAGLAIALMIDPDAELGPALEPEPDPQPDPPPSSEVLPPVSPTRFTIDLGGAATFGVGPFVSGAGYLRALLGLPGFVPFGLVGILQPFSRAESMAGNVDFTTVLAGLTICPLYFHSQRASFGACAGVDVGGALVVGRTLAEPLLSNERLLVQLDVQAYGRLTLYGPLAIQLLAALFVPFRNEAWITATGTFFNPEPVAAMVGLGLAIDLSVAGDGAVEQHVW